MDALNLFTGGWFGDATDGTLALYTDGWFDISVIPIIKRFRTTSNFTTILRREIGVATSRRQDVRMAFFLRRAIGITTKQIFKGDIANFREPAGAAKQIRFTTQVTTIFRVQGQIATIKRQSTGIATVIRQSTGIATIKKQAVCISTIQRVIISG